MNTDTWEPKGLYTYNSQRMYTNLMQVSYAAEAGDVLDALLALGPIYAARVELDQDLSTGGLRSWHVTLVSAEDYQPLFADGYLLEGTNAAVTVRTSIKRTNPCKALPIVDQDYVQSRT